MCSKIIKTSKLHHQCRSDVFIINFEHIAHTFSVFLLFILKKCLLEKWRNYLKEKYLQIKVDSSNIILGIPINRSFH